MCIFDDEKWLVGLFGLVGALIGGGATLYATRWAHNLDLEKAEKENKEEIIALLQAVNVEVNTLFEIYMENIGKQLESTIDGEAFNYYFYATQNYFTVYSSNANKIGRIEDKNLRIAIVKLYSHGRSLLDTYNMNNALYNKYDHNVWLYNSTGNNAFEKISEEAWEDLSRYSTSLKTIHFKFKDSFENFQNLIKEHIS